MNGLRIDTFVEFLTNKNMHSKEQIEAIANTLLPSFIPKDAKETTLSFHFTLPPDFSYKVFFEKDGSSKWQFKTYETAIR
jgi:hypothetical protein